MKHLPRNLSCRSRQHFKSSWTQLTALLMISNSHVRVIWGDPALFCLFNWAAFSNFGMNNVRPSVNVQHYTKKQTQSLPIDNNGCCVFHDYRWCPKYVPSSAEKNMSESWEFCENRTDSILVLNLGTSCLSYFRTLNHTEASTCFHASLLLLKFNRRASHFNGSFIFNTWETRKIQASQMMGTLLVLSAALHRPQAQWPSSAGSDWQSQHSSHLPAAGSAGDAASKGTCTGTALQCPPLRCSQEWSCPLTQFPELLL